MKVMKHHKVLPNRVFFAAVAALFLWLPTFAHAEDVRLFESDIAIQEDGSLLVTETIHYDFGNLGFHGIFRDIALQHSQASSVWYKQRHIDIFVKSVSRDGMPEQYVVKQGFNTTNIKIGDPDGIITGKHEYKINYRVEGGLSYLNDGTAELYWNATGHDWPVAIAKAVVTVHGNDGVLRAHRACYEGDYGSTQKCEVYTDADTASVFTTSLLVPGQELTIAQEIDPAKVSVNIVESVPWWVFAAFAFIFVVLFIVYALYRYETKYRPKNRTVIPQYEPYPGVLPMYTGVLRDGKLDSHDLTAGILQLAQDGFIKIKRTKKKALYFFEVNDYEVELLLSMKEVSTKFHRELLKLFFSSDVLHTRTLLSELKSDNFRRTKNSRRLQKLKDAIKEDLVKEGFYESLSISSIMITLTIGAFITPIVLRIFYDEVYFMFLFYGVVALIFGFYNIVYRRRTKKGYVALNHIKGFEEFLSVTDKERFSFHNAPKKDPETFFLYLPYAVALKVEDKWAKVFHGITIPDPSWYSGGSAFGGFLPSELTTDLGAFSSAFVSAASGGATSGSGGGGFSGGGGGGGGGGSW